MENLFEKIIGSNLENLLGYIWWFAAAVYIVIVYLRIKSRQYRLIMNQTGTDLSESIKSIENWITGLIIGDGFILYAGLLALLPADVDSYLTVSSAGVTFLLLTAVSLLIICFCSALLLLLLQLGKSLIEKN